MLKCKICGKAIEGDINNLSSLNFYAIDPQKDEVRPFCSRSCLRDWTKRKIIGMAIILAIGMAIGILGMIDGSPEALILIFIPYMIRDKLSILQDIFNLGTVGEIFAFAIAILASMTMIYPIIRLVKEITFYSEILKNTAEVGK